MEGERVGQGDAPFCRLEERQRTNRALEKMSRWTWLPFGVVSRGAISTVGAIGTLDACLSPQREGPTSSEHLNSFSHRCSSPIKSSDCRERLRYASTVAPAFYRLPCAITDENYR